MRKFILSFVVLVLCSACATLPGSNLVMNAVQPGQALVSVRGEILKAGDNVGVFTETCRNRRGVGPLRETVQTTCERNRVGAGQVIQVSPQDSEAVISTGPGVVPQRGMLVIKE